jgi:hypothetical protein
MLITKFVGLTFTPKETHDQGRIKNASQWEDGSFTAETSPNPEFLFMHKFLFRLKKCHVMTLHMFIFLFMSGT